MPAGRTPPARTSHSLTPSSPRSRLRSASTRAGSSPLGSATARACRTRSPAPGPTCSAVSHFTRARSSADAPAGPPPIAYFASHGLSDSVLNISGGRSLRDHFVQVNGVTPQNPPEPAVGSRTHICTTYRGGSPAYPVTWCAFDGDHNPNPHDSGQSTSWVPQQVWNFMTQF